MLKLSYTAGLRVQGLSQQQEAHALGVDGIVGIDLDYSEISGGGNSMLFLIASGTAVKLAPPSG